MPRTQRKTSLISDPINELYYYDEKEAELRLDFFKEKLSFPEGDVGGKPFVPMQWEQDEIIKPLFGWKSKKTGMRRYRTLFEYVPRKNNKTPLSAGLALCCHFMDKEFGAQTYMAANDEAQANICFKHAKFMVENNPDLMKASDIFKKSIIYPKYHSVFRVLSAESKTKDGLNMSCGVYDEVHEWSGRDLYDKLHTSTASRSQPLEIITTTAGTWNPTAIWMEIYKYAKRVISGEIFDPTFLAVVYEADPNISDLDPFSEKLWAETNPGYGITVKKDYMARESERARTTPSYLNTFKRYHLNIITKSESVWIPAHVWNANPVKKHGLEHYKGRQCFIGVDLANYHDLLPVALLFPNQDETVDLYLEYWVTHDKAADRKTKNEADYFSWQDQGYVNITPGNVADYQTIRKRIGEYSSLYGIDIKVIGYDDWNASQFAQDLAQDGATINPWSPSNNKLWNAPTKKMEAMATAGQINHMGNPVLAWNVENVVIRYTGEYVKPDKGKSKDKIDGVIASIIAIGEWMNFKDEGPKSTGFWDI